MQSSCLTANWYPWHAESCHLNILESRHKTKKLSTAVLQASTHLDPDHKHASGHPRKKWVCQTPFKFCSQPTENDGSDKRTSLVLMLNYPTVQVMNSLPHIYIKLQIQWFSNLLCPVAERTGTEWKPELIAKSLTGDHMFFHFSKIHVHV